MTLNQIRHLAKIKLGTHGHLVEINQWDLLRLIHTMDTAYNALRGFAAKSTHHDVKLAFQRLNELEQDE